MNLVKLALAVERWTAGHAPVTLALEHCLNIRDKTTACDRCVQVCPTGAITAAPDVQLNLEQCIACGLCLHRCPTGAFRGDDDAARLLRCAAQLVDRDSLELTCKFHADPASGDPHIDAVITTNGCLSRLGVSAYLGLFALGVQKIVLRLDACANCPLALLRTEIERAAETARQTHGASGETLVFQYDPPTRRAKPRPVYAMNNPPVSRRGLLRMITLQEESSTDALIAQFRVDDENDHAVPVERRRILAALRHSPQKIDNPLPADSFLQLTADDTCTACGLCARICPTQALQFFEGEDRFALTFTAANCVNCGLCTRLCDAGALHAAGVPSRADVIEGKRITLLSGTLKRCKKCHALYKGTGDFCPPCDFRKKHPFGYVANPRVSPVQKR